jgi:MFS transporter, putative metabolite:H+ symporter
MVQSINKDRLFLGSCFALITTAFSFSIRAGILAQLGTEYNFTGEQLGTINSMWFLGFPISMIVGGLIYNSVGGKNIMQFAFIAHAIGILLTIYSGGNYSLLLISTLLIGLGNGCTEAACNPMIADSYTGTDVGKMLNRFHMWFPGGIVIGSLISKFMTDAALPWQAQIWTIMIPTVIYVYLFWGQSFPSPKTSTDVKTNSNSTVVVITAIIGIVLFINYLFPNLILSSLGLDSSKIIILIIALICLLVSVYLQFGVLFAFIFACMMLTAISEFGPQQWTGLIMSKSGASPMLILALVTGTMAVCRYFAGPIYAKLGQTGVLLISAVLATAGILLFATQTGTMAYVAALCFAFGVALFWPTMLGFVAEKMPQTGAFGLSIVGGIGMFSTAIFQPIIGGWLDSEKATAIANGLTGDLAELTAGQATLDNIAVFPAILIVAFAGLYFYMRKQKTMAVA